MPLVSVVMPIYNGEKYLAETIESILAQTFSDFELILVDDASRDSSPEIMREYQRRDDRVRLLRADRNSGNSATRNRGIDAAGSEIIAFTDHDDVSLPTRLEKQIRFLQQNPEIGAVGVHSKFVKHDLTGSISIRATPRQHAPIVFRTFSGGIGLVGPALMIRARPLRAVGGFTPELRYAEEGDLFARLLLQTGVRFASIPEILYLQRQHGSNQSSSRAAVADRQINVGSRRVLSMLWDDVADDTLKRFRQLRHRQKLNWSDRRAAKRDLKRVIETLIKRQLVDESERPLLIADMNQRLELASPRLWQMFCHWRRHRFDGKDRKATLH